MTEPALRTFSDEENREWEVRAIRPAHTERRARLVSADLANGWLLFTLGLERRRLAPLPPGWHQATDTQLLRWCVEADPVVRPPGAEPPDSRSTS